MNQEARRVCTAEQLKSDDLLKNAGQTSSQDDAAHSSLNEHRLLGNLKNVAKTTRKGHLIDAITKIPPKGTWFPAYVQIG
ncbi:peptidyl-prolyl cis-trans isomerase FKBP3-like [Stigmatopora argus]